MKKLLLIGLLVFTSVSLSKADSVFSTNFVTTSAGIARGLLVGRANVKQIVLTATDNVTVRLFDMDKVVVPHWGTNYTNATYWNTVSYATNYVTSYIGMNGVTNWYTNPGIWTYSNNVVAATNALSPVWSGAIAANTAVTFNTDFLAERGLTIQGSTNCSIILFYNTGGQ